MAPKGRKKRVQYLEEAMQAACLAVTICKKGKREAARLHGVPESTMRERLNGKRPFHSVERTVVTAEEEQRIVEWMKECARRGFGRTSQQVKVAVQALLNQRGAVTVFKDNLPGKSWMTLFLKRHSDSITQSLGARQAAVTQDSLRVWVKATFSEITKVGDVFDDPSRIFNCDETGFPLIGGALSKGLAANSDKQVYKYQQLLIDTHTQTQITVLVCASATGDVHSPLIIFPGQRFGYDPMEGFPEAHFGKSTNGCIDSEIFTEWLRTAFIPAVEHLPKPVVLFADGHMAHLTLTVSDLCKDHNILIYQLPSRAGTTFTGLNQVLQEEVLKFKEENPDGVGKRNFSAVFKKAWAHGIKKDVVISGFRTAGLYPWNPAHFETDNVTLQTETEEAKAHVPGDTSHETVTTNIITLPPFSPSPSLDPPSPSPNSPPPALYSVDPTSTTHLSLLLPQPSSSSSEAVPPTPSTTSLYSLPAPSHVTSSTSETEIDNFSYGQALDRLLDLTAKAGVIRLIDYRTSHTLRTETTDPEERLFCSLYSRLMTASRHNVDKSKTLTMTADCLTFRTDEYRKKIQQVEENERRKQEREKRVEEEKEKKRVEEEKKRKKRVQEEKEKRKREVEEKRVEKEKVAKKARRSVKIQVDDYDINEYAN